jgi:hypothetical protein
MTAAVDNPMSDIERPEMFPTLSPAQAHDVEREEGADLDSSVELLRPIADVLDIRTVFSRVSEIANKLLPHDALIMSFVDQDGNVVRQAASTDDFRVCPSRRSSR